MHKGQTEWEEEILTPGGDHSIDHIGVNLDACIGKEVVQDERVLVISPLDDHLCEDRLLRD